MLWERLGSANTSFVILFDSVLIRFIFSCISGLSTVFDYLGIVTGSLAIGMPNPWEGAVAASFNNVDDASFRSARSWISAAAKVAGTEAVVNGDNLTSRSKLPPWDWTFASEDFPRESVIQNYWLLIEM